jgi:molybdopterin converting factor small subunit
MKCAHVRVYVSPALTGAAKKKGEQELEMELPATVGDVLAVLGLAGTGSLLISRNGRLARLEELLEDGDELGFYPPIGGGQ